MKKILYTILPLLFMAAGADAQTTILDGQVTVGATDVYLNGDKVFVSFSLDVSGLKVKSNREVILTPELRDTAFAAERKLLRSVSLFDVYEGDKLPEGKKSYALSFILEDKSRTLDDKTIERVMANLARQFEQRCGAQVRS